MGKKKGKIHIGTAGWHYKHWQGVFYPEQVRPPGFLSYYIQFLQTVELNNPFYRLPEPEKFTVWRKSVPEDFIFSVKASRFITHIKKLQEVQSSVENFIKNVSFLKEKLGVVLFQLPPAWNINIDRFENFIGILPEGYRYTFEFRNHTWYQDEIYEILRQYNVSFCIYELEHHQSPLIETADFVYIRLHGPEGKYAGNYSDQILNQWAERCLSWQKKGKDVYVYFDNDQLGYAAFNAIKLQEIVRNAY
jgi:uncharacterized protein YecE (DUF72 family)